MWNFVRYLAYFAGMVADGMDNGIGPRLVLLIARARPVDRGMERRFLSASIVTEVAS